MSKLAVFHCNYGAFSAVLDVLVDALHVLLGK